jgi:hypothetical protein
MRLERGLGSQACRVAERNKEESSIITMVERYKRDTWTLKEKRVQWGKAAGKGEEIRRIISFIPFFMGSIT